MVLSHPSPKERLLNVGFYIVPLFCRCFQDVEQKDYGPFPSKSEGRTLKCGLLYCADDAVCCDK